MQLDYGAMVFTILTFLLGGVWGAVFCMCFISYRIDRGKLPKGLKEKKEQLISLLQREDESCEEVKSQ